MANIIPRYPECALAGIRIRPSRVYCIFWLDHVVLGKGGQFKEVWFLASQSVTNLEFPTLISFIKRLNKLVS